MENRVEERLVQWAIEVSNDHGKLYTSPFGRLLSNGGVYVPPGKASIQPFSAAVAETEAAVVRLPEILRNVVAARYLMVNASMARRAKRCKMSESSFYRHLKSAHTILEDDLFGRPGGQDKVYKGVKIIR